MFVPCSAVLFIVRSRPLIPPTALESDRVGRSSPASSKRTEPVRTCVGCRGKGLRSALFRIVVQNGVLHLDSRRRLPGRGAWIHPDLECLDLAERRRGFSRALRLAESPDSTLVRDQLTAVLTAGGAGGLGPSRPSRTNKQRPEAVGASDLYGKQDDPT